MKLIEDIAMFQMRDNKVYQLIRFTPTTGLTLGLYSTRQSAEMSRDKRKASATTDEECYFVIKEWQLDDLTIPDSTGITTSVVVSPDLTSSVISPKFTATTNTALVNTGSEVVSTFSDRVEAVCAALLQLVPENEGYIESQLDKWRDGDYPMGDLSFIRENLTEFANSQNIVLVIE